ncbi:MAG: histidine kinase [Eubacterium sp.]|nr:histidine kinase [Eubacterium sp.]
MRLTDENALMIALDAALILQLFGLWIAVMLDEYIHDKRRRLMLATIGVACVLLVQEHVSWLVADELPVALHKLVSVIGYTLRPVIIVLFIKIQKPEKSMKLIWGVVLGNALVHMTTFFSGICFTHTETGGFVRGPLGYTSFIVSGVLLVVLVVGGFREFTIKKKSDYVIPMFASIFVAFSAIAELMMDTSTPISFLIVAVVSACVFYYVWLHMAFIREHEMEMEAGQRIKIMMSQIQPHFLFNTLATVRALYRKDPDLADDTLEKFGVYLRQNIDSLDKPDLIPFSEELKHTRVYADIEKIRFPSIEIKYDIEEDDFEVPALTIQPLVENAIRHGVRIREHGLIEVVVRKKRYGHSIVIKDNGKGFDTDAPMSTERSHIGLSNVKDRIESMCHGDMKIDSKIDEGTTITIRLPYSGESLQ